MKLHSEIPKNLRNNQITNALFALVNFFTPVSSSVLNGSNLSIRDLIPLFNYNSFHFKALITIDAI